MQNIYVLLSFIYNKQKRCGLFWLYTTKTLTEDWNCLLIICGNIPFSGQIGSHACVLKLFCKCNFPNLLVWPSQSCLGFIPLTALFSWQFFCFIKHKLLFTSEALFWLSQTLQLQLGLLKHCWPPQEQVLGAAKEPEPLYPLRMSD